MLEESETSRQKTIGEKNAERYQKLTDAHFEKHGLSPRHEDFVLRLRKRLQVGDPHPWSNTLEMANIAAWKKRKLKMVKNS